MNTKPTDTPTLGARVTNRRGGPLPGLAATLRVAELPNERNGQLVLVYNSEGGGYYLHPSPTHTGRWNLGSRTVAFAPGEPDAATGQLASVVPGARPQDGPELHVGTEHRGLSGVWVVCSCGLATRHQAARLAEAAWSEYRAHALDALREAVSVAHAVQGTAPNTGSSPETDTNLLLLVRYLSELETRLREAGSGDAYWIRAYLVSLAKHELSAVWVEDMLRFAQALGDTELAALVYNAAADEDLA